MCIVLFQWQPASKTPLIFAANRDEFYARPTESARWRGDVFCGIDKRAGGTWFGVRQDGRFAAVTNFRESIDPLPACTELKQLETWLLHIGTTEDTTVTLQESP